MRESQRLSETNGVPPIWSDRVPVWAIPFAQT
jgi:hypothetical protein